MNTDCPFLVIPSPPRRARDLLFGRKWNKADSSAARRQRGDFWRLLQPAACGIYPTAKVAKPENRWRTHAAIALALVAFNLLLLAPHLATDFGPQPWNNDYILKTGPYDRLARRLLVAPKR